MDRTGLLRLCALGLAWGFATASAFGASEVGTARPHCREKSDAAAPAARASGAAEGAEVHLSSLFAAHELTAIEMGGGAMGPMHWGARDSGRPVPEPAAPAPSPVSKSHADRGCTS